MVGGLESARFGRPPLRAVHARRPPALLRDPELATARMRRVLALAGIEQGARLSFNPMTADAGRSRRRSRPAPSTASRGSGPGATRSRELGAGARAPDRRRRPAGVEPLPRRLLHRARNAGPTDNRRAVEEAAALGTDVLVLVCGPPAHARPAAARAQIAAGIERLLPYAAELGVRLGIEPLHPMLVGERSAIVTLGEANDIVERLATPASAS